MLTVRPAGKRHEFTKIRGTLGLFATIGFMLVFASFGQQSGPIQGTIVTEDGKPIAGVSVHGSRFDTKSNEKGEFRISQLQPVIHFQMSDYQPFTVVVKPGTTSLRVVLRPSASVKKILSCKKPEQNETLVGWGELGLHFLLRKSEVEFLRGEPDVDYLLHIVKPKTGDDHLELWFGPYTLLPQPDDELFENSIRFEQRNLRYGNADWVDSWGELQNGKRWRWTSVFGAGGAVYREASSESAKLFDPIIDSICNGRLRNE